MNWSKAWVSFSLVGAVAAWFPAQAAEPLLAPVAGVSGEILKWRNDVLGQYSPVTYMDVAGRPMQELDFLRLLSSDHKPSFTMTVTREAGRAAMAIRVLPPEAGQGQPSPSR